MTTTTSVADTTTETAPTAPRSRSKAERATYGKSVRQQMPLQAHAELVTAAEGADPVELLESQSATRVPELVPIRYGRMLVSPFTFYRGAALIMADDLAQGPRTVLNTQLCGDVTSATSVSLPLRSGNWFLT